MKPHSHDKWRLIDFYRCKICKMNLGYEPGDFYITPRGLFILCISCMERYNLIFGNKSMEIVERGEKQNSPE